MDLGTVRFKTDDQEVVVKNSNWKRVISKTLPFSIKQDFVRLEHQKWEGIMPRHRMTGKRGEVGMEETRVGKCVEGYNRRKGGEEEDAIESNVMVCDR